MPTAVELILVKGKYYLYTIILLYQIQGKDMIPLLGFALQYSQTKDHEVTIVLSTIYTSGWVGIGFSRDGKMLNSSCIVGWVNLEGQGRIKQYHIKGFSPSEIKADRGELPLTNVPPYVAVQGATIYLSFQLKFNTTLKTQPILLAFSTKTPHHHRLTVHEDKTTVYFDFSSG